MERVKVSTPDGQLSDTDDTGTTSMISSLLGDETPKFILEPGYRSKLPEIPELSSTYLSPRSLHAYTGPGKMIDATFLSESRLGSDATPVANKMKAVLGSIEKLKTSSHQSLKGSMIQINSQSNAALSQVLNALHTHDLTMKSLKDALNEIEIATEESIMDTKSPTKLSSLRQLNRSQRILNKKDGESIITKEWVQNEVEIQIDYLRKSLNIDQIRNMLLHLKQENVEEKEYRTHVQELIKNEVNDQLVGIRDSNQNLKVLDQVEDLLSTRNDQFQANILKNLHQDLRLILKDEADKIMSAVSEITPAYVTEPELNLAIQNALTEFSNKINNGTLDKAEIAEKINRLNEKMELFMTSMPVSDVKKDNEDLEARIIKLEYFLQKENHDALQTKVDDLEKDIQRVFKVLDLNTKTQEKQQSEMKAILSNESNFKKELSSKITALEAAQSVSLESKLQAPNSELERRMSLFENQLKEIASHVANQNSRLLGAVGPTSEDNLTKNHDLGNSNENKDRESVLLSRIIQLEATLDELKTQSNTFSSSPDSKTSILEKKMSHLDKIVDDHIAEISLANESIKYLKGRSQLQESVINEASLIQSRMNLLETEISKIGNAQNNHALLTSRINSVIDSRWTNQKNAGSFDPVIPASISKLQSDIASQKIYIDSKLSECQSFIQNFFHKADTVQNLDLLNKKLADVSKKVDILCAEAVISKDASENLKEDLDGSDKFIENILLKSSTWKKTQDQISQLSSLAPKLSLLESATQDKLSELNLLKKEMDHLKKIAEKGDIAVKRPQSQQATLDINTRLSVLANRISEIESRSKASEKVKLLGIFSLSDILDDNLEMREMKQKLDKFGSEVRSLDDKILSIILSRESELSQIKGINISSQFLASKDIWESAQLKIADIESIVKINIIPTIKNIESDKRDQGETLRTMNNNIKTLQEDKSSVQLEIWISSHISKLRQELESKFENKVDNDVLEELVKHLATREELKKVAKKKMGSISDKRSNERKNRSNVLEDLDENTYDASLEHKLKKELEKYLSDQIKSLETRLQAKESIFAKNDLSGANADKTDMQSIKKFTETLINDKMKLILNNQSIRARKEGSAGSDDEIDFLEQKMRREFDEKLFLLCSDLSSCKNMISSQLYEPFHRCAQWIWKSGHLKLGSAVPWNIQTRNTDEDNFQWEQDTFNIKVSEAGLYEITMAFFTKTKPSVQLVVNGESIMSAINSPSYIVHHSSGYVIDGNGKMQEGVVSGLSLVDFLALPSKSTLSIHYHGVKKQTLGHGFLGLRKL